MLPAHTVGREMKNIHAMTINFSKRGDGTWLVEFIKFLPWRPPPSGGGGNGRAKPIPCLFA